MLRIAVARVLESPVAGDEAMPGWMGPSERQRWARLSPAARRAFAASRALLRELLHEACGIDAEAWDVSAQAGTAPVARSLRVGFDAGALHVSLSHRLGWVAASVGDVPVGVDIECERPARSDPRERAALMLSPAEFPSWQALAIDERESALLTRWTAKEAWFKARPPEAAPWDFRRIDARACAPADAGANVRTWASPPVHVALCCADAQALAAAECRGLAGAASSTSFWRVRHAAHPT